MRRQVVEADWTWTGAAFEPGVRVAVDAGGRIETVGRLQEPPTLRLDRRALLPGFVNAHSHAFQRGLRGEGETYPETAGDFWSWREAMYALVERLDAERVYELSVRAYREMLDRGITAVGEFHYLHHAAGEAYELDEAVARAAEDAGIRLVLLQTYYRTGGIGRPLAGAQRRFSTPDLDDYRRQLDRLVHRPRPASQTVGVAAHSVRAAEPAEIVALRREAARRGMVFHMHVEEQPLEIEACRRAYGATPLALLLEERIEGESLTAVHCTQSDPAELLRFSARGGQICLCPLTEAGLGDGLPDLDAVVAAGAGLCLGTDSNARISFGEEIRWLELGQRLRGRRRGMVRDRLGRVGAPLLEIASRGGAQSLGLENGRIAAGCWADFALLDLDDPALAECDPRWLAEAFVFGAGDGAISAVCVGGRWRWRGGED